MNRFDIIFDMHYSHHLELMHATLMGRIDKLLSILLLVLGGSAFAQFGSLFIFGAAVALVSAFQFVCQPGNESGRSLEHARKYLQLITIEPTLTDEELFKRFIEAQSLDNLPWGTLKNAAYKRAAIKLNLIDETPPLTFIERCVARMAGDLPRSPIKNDRSSIHPESRP
ncbi:hypothetical protein [Yersinia hibernica]|uniref:Uncharacterized protein n=1 Tax=Yersinia enterocolitica LC20 TaxID=1443113 RepID=A0A7U4GE82_YEREN|nr:hypothetical protein [Yersinia hibernica]AHM72987.1 hypothetical protein LC20_01734 [Yersinia hibernica]